MTATSTSAHGSGGPTGPDRTALASRTGLVQVALAGVLWGTGGLAVQLIREQAPLSALTISVYRMGLAAAVLLAAVVLLRRGGALLALARRSPARSAVVGACTGSYQALYFAAVVEAGVSVATVVSLGLAPVLLAVAEHRQGRSLPGPRQLAVLGAALTGLVLVSLAADAGSGPRPGIGIALALASGSAYAQATALGRPLARAAAPLELTAATTTVGTLVLVPLALLGGGPFATGDRVAWAWLAYLGVLTMALAYGLLYAGLRTVSGARATIATLLEPVTAALVAWAVLGERLGLLGVAGGVLILLAVALTG